MGTHYKGKKNEVRALDAYLKLMRAADTLAVRSLRYMKEHGLSETQFGVLETLLHLGPMHQNIIGEKLLKSGGNITMVIDNLERRQLIRRVVNPEDRRCVQVNLTDQGQKLISEIFPPFAALVAQAMNALAIEEQTQLAELSRKLGVGVAKITYSEPFVA